MSSSMIAVGKSNFVTSATGLVDDGVPLSRVHEIKTPKVERVLLRQHHQMREFVTGTLCLTDRHLIFVEPTGAQETWVLYHHISSVERQPLTTKGYPLVISCKIFQQLHLIIPRESDCLDTMETIHKFAQPEKYSELYAYQYQPNSDTVKQSSGWLLYDAPPEYARMGVPNKHWQETTLNANYELCDTYSCHLFVPASAGSTTIQGSAKFRSKGRLPILSYYYAPKKSALCRSSQPLAGLLGRSAEDEEMVQCILQANPNSDTLYVLDTRPRINAMANRAAGKGYESAGYYPNMIYQFYNIQNIHVMRESLQKVMEGLYASHQSMSGFLSCLDSSGWLRHIQLIMEASVFSAKALLEGSSVLVHCSDGWDRTAQTCALTSLFLDPYYRNLHGFMILIEKEWLSCGHKFTQRCGHTVVEEKETSPIFTQFIECVWQVMVQMPTAFQFNEHFLITLHDHAHSCQFGTFLGNCEKERSEQRFSEQTYSLWGHIWDHLDDYLNPLYCHGKHTVIEPNTDIRQLKFWRGLYGRYCFRERQIEKEEELLASLQQQSACLEEHIRFLTQTQSKLKKVLESVKTLQSFPNCSSQSNITHTPQGKAEEGREGEKNLVDGEEVEDSGCSEQNTNDNNGQSDRQSTERQSTTVALAEREDKASHCGNSRHHRSPSPDPVSELKDCLTHVPEMNLPWQSLRGVQTCSCGRAFTILVSKYHCSYCGTVFCDACASSHVPLPWHATPRPHRVCRSCHKLMRRRMDMEQSENS